MTPIFHREQWLNRLRAAGRLCRGTRVDGTPCNALALEGSEFCRWHDPSPMGEALRRERAEKLAATRSQRRAQVQRRTRMTKKVPQ